MNIYSTKRITVIIKSVILLFILTSFPASPTVPTNFNTISSMENYVTELNNYQVSLNSSLIALGILFLVDYIIDFFFIKEITYDIPSLLNNSSSNQAIVNLESKTKRLQNQLDSLIKTTKMLEYTSTQNSSPKKQEGKILQERK